MGAYRTGSRATNVCEYNSMRPLPAPLPVRVPRQRGEGRARRGPEDMRVPGRLQGRRGRTQGRAGEKGASMSSETVGQGHREDIWPYTEPFMHQGTVKGEP